jgi:putative phage-type endonuclease
VLPYKVITGEANTPAWLRGRKGFLGASEVACVLGLSKWATRLSIYVDKLSDNIDDTMDERQEWGHRLEDAIAAWVQDSQGITVLPSPGLLQSTVYEWLGATPDRVTPDGEPVELKTSDTFMKHDWDDGPPAAYVIQVMVQMIVLGARRGYLAVLHGGNRAEFFPIEWDQAVADQIIDITREFWFGNVVAKVAPEPISSDEAALAWPSAPDVPIEGGEALHEAWGAYGLLQAELKEIEQQLDGMKLEFQKAMGADATSLTCDGQPLFTWKTRKGSTRLDTKALRDAHPDIAAEFTKTGEPARTFIRKTIKEVK